MGSPDATASGSHPCAEPPAGLGVSGRSACRRSTRIPEPIQPPVVPEGKLSTASSASSLISVRYRSCPVGREGLGVSGEPKAATVTPLLQRGFDEKEGF